MDERRITQNRNFCLCCIKHKSPVTISHNDQPIANLPPQLELAMDPRIRSQSQSTNNAPPQLQVITSGPTSANIDTESTPQQHQASASAESRNTTGIKRILEYISVGALISKLIVPLQQKRFCRISIVIIFIAFNVASILSLRWLDTASDSSTFVPDGSFVISWNDEATKAFGPVTFTETVVIPEHTDFSNKTIRNRIEKLIADVEAYNTTHGYSLGSLDTWYWDFLTWLNDSLIAEAAAMNETDYRTIDDITRIEFYDYLQEFANDTTQTGYARWDSVLVYGYDDEGNIFEVEATKWFIFTNKAANLGDIWPFKKDLDKVMVEDMKTKDGFFFDSFFVWAYLEYVIVILTVTNMGFALIGVLIVMIVLMDLKMSVFIAVVVVMIDIGMFFLIYLFCTMCRL